MKIGLLGILMLIFVVGKLAGVIQWSWWLVLLPAIIGLSLWALSTLLMLALFVLATVAGR